MSWRVIDTEKNRELWPSYIGNVYSSDRPPGGRPAPDLTWTDLAPTHRITHSWEHLDGAHVPVP